VRNPEIIKQADYVFIESTYGDRLHEPIKERNQKFLEIIHDTFERKGKLMIPSFAIERAQEIIYDLNTFVEKNLIPKKKVFLDSPMAIKATEVFKKHPEEYNKEVKQVMDSGDNPFSFPGLSYSKTVDDSKKINFLKDSCIVIAGSGMCTAGRIKHHIKNHIDDSKNTILFVGYQVQGTLGYWIKKGEKRVRLLGTEIDVNAKVESIDRSFKAKKVFICHGEEKTCFKFAKKVEKLGFKTYIPSLKEEIKL